MKTYKFYLNNDSKEEAIGKTVARNMYDAVHKFAQRKGLTVDAFMSIFSLTTV